MINSGKRDGEEVDGEINFTCVLITCAPLDGVVHALEWSTGKPRE